MLETSFALLHEAGACEPRYKFLAKALGGIEAYGRTTPTTLEQILDLNGLDDALWALRAVKKDQSADRDRIARLFACDCAEHVLHLYEAKHTSPAPRNAIAVARGFAVGGATSEELAAAWAAAGDAARAAAWAAAGAAAWAAARAAAWAAAWDAETAHQTELFRTALRND